MNFDLPRPSALRHHCYYRDLAGRKRGRKYTTDCGDDTTSEVTRAITIGLGRASRRCAESISRAASAGRTLFIVGLLEDLSMCARKIQKLTVAVALGQRGGKIPSQKQVPLERT